MVSQSQCHLHLFSFPDDTIDRILNNLPYEDLFNCRLVCQVFNKSVKRVLASVITLEDDGEPIEMVIALLPFLKNVNVIRHFAIGTGDDDQINKVLTLISAFCPRVRYIENAPVAFVYDYIMQLEEKRSPVSVSKIKVSSAYELNCRELSILLEKYPLLEVFIDEVDLHNVLNETWSDDDGLLRQRITGLNPGLLKLNSSPTDMSKLLSCLSNLRSLWIKVSIENVDLISTLCPRLSHLYIEDNEASESPDFCQIETFIRNKVPSLITFSLCITYDIPEEKVKHLLQLLVQSKARFRLFPETEWLSCDLGLGDNWKVWTKESILYIKSWPPAESLQSVLYLFLPVKRIFVEQAVSQITKDEWMIEIDTCTRQMRVKPASSVSFQMITSV